MELALAPLLSSLFIILREGFEALLIIMLIFSYVEKVKQPEKNKYVWYGIGAGILGSSVVAIAFSSISFLTHDHEEIFEGLTLIVASSVMVWVAFWCHNAQSHFKSGMIETLTFGTSLALSFTVFFAILREGFEVILFYAGLFSSSIADQLSIIIGAIAGMSILIFVYIFMDKFVKLISTDKFFKYSKYGFALLAVYFFYNGIGELAEAAEALNTSSVDYIDEASPIYVGPIH